QHGGVLFFQQYQSDRRFGEVVGVFSVLVLLITCLGVLGLTTYTIHKRTKEIGIRKVLGASAPDIVGLLSFEFVRLIALALVVAIPITWYAMNTGCKIMRCISRSLGGYSGWSVYLQWVLRY